MGPQNFTQNLSCSLKKLRIMNFIIVALDHKALEYFSGIGAPVFNGFQLGPNGTSVPSGDYGSA